MSAWLWVAAFFVGLVPDLADVFRAYYIDRGRDANSAICGVIATAAWLAAIGLVITVHTAQVVISLLVGVGIGAYVAAKLDRYFEPWP